VTDNFIDINIDKYGSKGRLGALADYWEVCAIAGLRLSRSDIGDAVRDNGWANLEVDRLQTPLDATELSMGAEQDRSVRTAGRVLDLILQRSNVLGDGYPFALSRQSLQLKPRYDLRSSHYVALLAMTVVHAWDLDSGVDPELTFERYVERALSAFGVPSHGMGTAARDVASFPDRLHAAASALGLRADPDAAIRSRFAQDEGVDVLATLLWRDSRVGQWTWIGQATCAGSEQWKSKINDPSPKQWERFLLESLRPIPFLAVPHHIETREFEYLIERGKGATVLDRLRLCMATPGLVADELRIVEAMIGAGVALGAAA